MTNHIAEQLALERRMEAFLRGESCESTAIIKDALAMLAAYRSSEAPAARATGAVAPASLGYARGGMTAGELSGEAPAQSHGEAVAFMWQHDETGRTGFVEAGFDRAHWEKHNPRLHIIGPLYRHPVQPAARMSEEQERAAMVCERRAKRASTLGRQVEAYDCAAAIREG